MLSVDKTTMKGYDSFVRFGYDASEYCYCWDLSRQNGSGEFAIIVVSDDDRPVVDCGADFVEIKEIYYIGGRLPAHLRPKIGDHAFYVAKQFGPL